MNSTLSTTITRVVLSVKGYLFLNRSWHCAWVMAQRIASPSLPVRRDTTTPGHHAAV